VIGNIVKKLRVNEQIRAAEVRLVGEKGEQLGIMPLGQARETARRYGLDLVEVAPTATPPVCRLMDYGRFKYEQAKRERGDRRSQKITLLREVRLRPKIGEHDFQAKVRTARKLLAGGDKLKVTILFRGREITHPELGWKLLQRMNKEVEGLGVLERQPAMEGRRMSIIIAPTTQKGKPKEAAPGTKEPKEPEYAEAENT